MPYLIFFRRGQELMRVALDRAEMTVGGGAGADVVVPDPAVAAVQAALVQVGDRWRLDDRSGQGTAVCGKRTDSAWLEEGTDVAFGGYRAIYRDNLSDFAADAHAAKTLADGLDAPTLPREVWLMAQEPGTDRQLQIALGPEIEVGSGDACGLRLPHPTVSARHARIGRQDGRIVIQDLGSKNGVRINGVRSYESELPLGVRARIGVWDVWVASARDERPKGVESFEGIITADPAMKQILAQIDRIAASKVPVVVFGETGTGKELVSRAIHRRSGRGGAPLIPINCGAIAHELMEAELFGHEKGAFTGAGTARKGALAEADGGTIFLDEIGELPLDLQPKLLRAIELGEVKPVGASRPGTVDVRYVFATHRNLADEVGARRFREDLYYRIAVATLHLPPLRQRRGDVMVLWQHFMKTLSPPDMIPTLAPGAEARLAHHDWPGNVRELRNVAQRALLVATGPELREDDIQFDPRTAGRAALGENAIDPRGMTLQQVEKSAIEIVLRSVKGNRNAASRQLDIAKSTLFKKIAEYGLGGGGDSDEVS